MNKVCQNMSVLEANLSLVEQAGMLISISQCESLLALARIFSLDSDVTPSDTKQPKMIISFCRCLV